jgi:cholesterol transport system auxiliary component
MKFLRSPVCLVILALGSGCALLTKSEPVIPRYFSPESVDAPGPRATATGLELRLGRVNSDAYIKDRLVYRDSEFEVGYYDDRVWTDKPEAYVRRALARALFDERGVTQQLSGVGATLEVDVVAFEEVLKPVHLARVKLVYEIYDDRVVRLSRSVVVERPILASKGDAAASDAVQAISLALVAAVDAVADAAAAELRSEETAATKVAR